MAVHIAVHNLCHDLPRSKVLDDLELAAANASVGLVCERSSDAARAAFSDFRDRDDIAAFLPDGAPGRDPIWWKTSKWVKAGAAGWMKTHDGKEGVSPDRFFTWQALERTSNNAVVMFVNTHAINGYAKEGPSAPGNQEYRDESAMVHWAKGRDLIEGFISDHWPTIVVGGDWNCTWSNGQEDWYPGPMLADLLRTPPWDSSILYATTTEGSDGVHAGKDSLPAHSDHDIKILAVDL